MEPEGLQSQSGQTFRLTAAAGGLAGKVLRTLRDGHILALMQPGPVAQYRGKPVLGAEYIMLLHPQDIYKDNFEG